MLDYTEFLSLNRKEMKYMSKYVERTEAMDCKITAGAINLEKDRAIWGAYSQDGGLYDLLQQFHSIVEKPSANAFVYDPEEHTYTICITLYNTIFHRLHMRLIKVEAQLKAAEQHKYCPTTRKVTVTHTISEPKPKRTAPPNGFLCWLWAVDQRLTHYRIYAAIRRQIVTLVTRQYTSPKENVQIIEIYNEEELSLASYQMQHGKLLDTIVDLVVDMSQSLKPVCKENSQALSYYQEAACRIDSEVVQRIFSNPKWEL